MAGSMKDLQSMSFFIKLDYIDRESGVFRGRILDSKGGIPFSSVSRMLILMDTILDFPPSLEAKEVTPGQILDFQIDILFHQGTSWQGRVIIPGRKRPLPFASIMDLIIIIETTI